jgi:hypothetical protein
MPPRTWQNSYPMESCVTGNVVSWFRLREMILNEVDPAAREMAHRLIAIERGGSLVAPEDRDFSCSVCEKLRRPLSRLVGSAGVSSLVRRALTLAKRESPALHEVEVLEDGSLKGLEGDALQASDILIAHLIQLLATFIGEGLTLRILRDAWPELDAMTGSLERSGL